MSLEFFAARRCGPNAEPQPDPVRYRPDGFKLGSEIRGFSWAPIVFVTSAIVSYHLSQLKKAGLVYETKHKTMFIIS